MHLQNTLNANSPSRRGNAALPGDAMASGVRVFAPIRWCFLLFVASIPFECVQVFGEIDFFTGTKAIGLFLGALALLQPRVCFAWPPKAFWFFTGFLAVFALRAVIEPRFDRNLGLLSTLAQCLILFWLSYNLIRYGQMQRSIFATFVLANIAVAALAHMGIGATESMEGGVFRETMFGQNENLIAYVFDLGVLSAVGIAINKNVRFIVRVSMIPLIPVMVAESARTGSRGALLAVAVGLLTFVLGSQGVGGRIKAVFVVGVMAAVLGHIVLNTDVLRERIDSTVEKGHIGGRDKIFGYCLDMFMEKPLIGWGPTTNMTEVAKRTNELRELRDTHNDVLWVLTATGLAGGVLFFSGLWLCLWGAWKGRSGAVGLTTLALLLTSVAMGVSGTMFYQKTYWMIMAMGAVSGAAVAASQRAKATSRSLSRSFQR
jgi:O-antigen ligase